MIETESCQEKSRGPELRCKLVALNSRYIHSSPALFYIRNELEKHIPEVQTDILQVTINDNYYETLLAVTDGEPDAVFVSANIWNSDRVEQLVCDLNGCLPGLMVIVGGPQASVIRDRPAAKACTVVVGEIEAIGTGFYRDLLRRRMQPVYTGSFLQSGIGKLAYPFTDDDFAIHLADRHIYYETSRGCPHSCTYCLSAAEKGLFHKGIPQVREELLHILSHKPKVVRFVDRTFNDSPKRATAIWEFLLSLETETLFHFEIAPERFTEEMFALLTKAPAGRFQFEIGVQSTNAKTLEAVKRNVDTDTIHGIIARLAALKTIHLHVDLILGLPFESGERFGKSFSDLFAMGSHYIQMGLLKILPDTPIAKQAEEFGYRWSASPPYPVFSNRWIDHREMRTMYRFCECVEKFHNNRYFTTLWNYLRERCDDMYLFFRQLLDVGMARDLFGRAPTQEFLTTLLVEQTREREDGDVILEILRFSWLRCGFKKLPDILEYGAGEQSGAETKDSLYRELPENLQGVFTDRSRNAFFRRSVFLSVTARGAAALGYPDTPGGRFAFSNEREGGLYNYNRMFFFSGAGSENPLT